MIISNSIDAINTTGNIFIRTKLTNQNASIEIEVTGEGIPSENLKKVIDPFFTTKDPGKGTGLGLSIAYNIIKKQSGEIESKLGKGTIVKII
jgi:two-component system, NtrC family, sensor kinase